MSRTGFYTHPDCQRHDMGRGHPECPDRLSAIRDRLLVSGVDQGLIEHEAPLAKEEDILLAHDPRLVEAVGDLNREIQNEAAQGGRALMHIDPDTAMCEHSYNAAMRAVGAALAATDAVLAGELDNAFCAIRPPGHHATRSRSMGFCIFNSLAIAVMHALERHGLERVAVIDFDVHHGNGTEDILALNTSQLVSLSTAQLNALDSAQLSALATDQVAALTTRQLAGLGSDQLNALTTAQFAALSATQAAALTTDQVAALETADVAVLSFSGTYADTGEAISGGSSDAMEVELEEVVAVQDISILRQH